MGKFVREITSEYREFIESQRIFFVATADSDGSRINLSPKGLDSLAILDDRTLAYYDFPGSGNETANHLAHDGRITLMWCAFEGKPRILRAYCYGETVDRSSPRFEAVLCDRFPSVNAAVVRQIVVARIESLQTSCGFGVPLFEYVGDRSMIVDWAETKIRQGTLEEYMEKNCVRNDEKFPIERNDTAIALPHDA